MDNSYRLTIRNAPALRVIDGDSTVEQDRLAFRTCFMIWMGLIASTWAVIAFIFSLI